MRIRVPKSPFSISLTLHASVFICLILSTAFQGCSEPEEEFVFDMVFSDAPVLEAVDTPAPTPPIREVRADPQPEEQFTQLEPLRPRPAIEISAPQAPELSDPEPQPRVEPEPAPEPERPRMTLEEFRRLNPRRPQPATRNVPTRPRVDFQAINTEGITQSLENTANQAQPSTPAADAQKIADYQSRLRRFIAAQLKEDNTLPSQNLSVEVQFSVDGNGRVTAYRITRRSGLQAFDRSVDQLFSGLQTVPAPPDRKPRTFTIPFRLE